MTYIPQVVGITDSTIDSGAEPLLTIRQMYISGGGSGFISGDVGATVTLTGGTYTTQATGIIASVGGGSITALSFGTVGVYTVLPSSPYAITGGSGTGATVALGTMGAPLILQQGAAGFSTPMTGFTISIWTTMLYNCWDIIENLPGVEIWGTELWLYDASSDLIYNASFTPPFASSTEPMIHWMFAVDVPSQTAQLYINDAPATLDTSINPAGWHSTNPILNSSSSLWTIGSAVGNGRNGGGVNLISLWMSDGYTDISDETFRRNFINSDLSVVDPATYPSAQLSFYTEPGDAPSEFANNQGTGGAFTVFGGTLRWAEQVVSDVSLIPFLVADGDYVHTFSGAESGVPFDGSLQGSWAGDTPDYTTRPFGGVDYPTVVTEPSNGMLTLNTDGTFTYTANSDFVGTDTFQYTVEESMPSPCQAPGYSASPCDVSITVEAPPPTPVLSLVSLYAFDDGLGDDYGFNAESDFPTNFTQLSQAIWCCQDVHINSPSGADLPPAVSFDFSPSQISIAMYGVDGSLRFSGTWAVADPVGEYQVLFSIDSEAQTYTLYVNNVVPTGSPTWGAAGTIGWA